jgi:hypothetical protein
MPAKFALVYLPARIAPKVKRRLRQLARARKIASVSAFVREAVEEKLAREGLVD